MKQLQDRVALVSGAASGIGQAIALNLAAQGAAVAAVDINRDGAQKTVQQITAQGGCALALHCDLASQSQITDIISAINSQFKRLDIVVNSAGISPLVELEKIELAEWERVLAINLTAPFLIIQAAWQHLKTAGNKGRIINIGSLSGQMGGIAVGLHYTSSKGGLMAMTKQLARLLAPSGGTVNNISPGTTDTPLIQDWPQETRQALVEKIPLGRLGTPQDVAQAACFLASDAAQFITGATININGGMFIA